MFYNFKITDLNKSKKKNPSPKVKILETELKKNIHKYPIDINNNDMNNIDLNNIDLNNIQKDFDNFFNNT
jgi:hypothetical protein